MEQLIFKSKESGLRKRTCLPAWLVILTPLFNASRGSLFIAVLYHIQIMNPIFPDARPWDNFLFAIAAVVIVFFNRRQMFQRGSGVTEVLTVEKKSAHQNNEQT